MNKKLVFSFLLYKLMNQKLFHEMTCLLFFTDSNNVHRSPSGEIVVGITHTSQFMAFWLVEIVKCFWVSQLILLNILEVERESATSSNKIYVEDRSRQSKMANRKLPPEVLHKEGKSNGSYALDQKFGKHVISREDKF